MVVKVLVSVLFMVALVCVPLVFSGCEPTNWDLITAPPEPVSNLTWDETVGGTGDIEFTFTLPEFSDLTDLFPDYSFGVYLYYRTDPGTEEIFLSEWSYNESAAGTEVTQIENTGLGAGSYVFILYTVDEESQKSEPAETGTVTW